MHCAILKESDTKELYQRVIPESYTRELYQRVTLESESRERTLENTREHPENTPQRALGDHSENKSERTIALYMPLGCAKHNFLHFTTVIYTD